MPNLDHSTRTANCVKRGCRRPECVARNRAYKRRMNSLSRMGRSTLVDAGPVREKIALDVARGWTHRQIAERADIELRTLSTLMSQDRTATETARKIMTARMTGEPEGFVSALGTRRRLQALTRDGHSRAELSERLGYPEQWILSMTQGVSQSCQWPRARDVRELFKELWLTPGDHRQATNAGIRMGWPRPGQWPHSRLDDPAGRPDYGPLQTETCLGTCGRELALRSELRKRPDLPRECLTEHYAGGRCRRCYARSRTVDN